MLRILDLDLGGARQLTEMIIAGTGEGTNHWTEPIECQIVANLDSFFSVTLLKHFCQSVSFYYWEDNINIVQYKYCFYLCENDDV